MRYLFVLFIMAMGFNNVFPDSSEIVDFKNEYNGTTEEIVPDNNKELVKILRYRDNLNEIKKVEYILTKNKSIETGIKQQSNFFSSSKVIEKYEMLFTEEYCNIHGINRLVEYVDLNDNIIKMEWYIDNLLVDFLDDINISNKFPYYKIGFIKTKMFEADAKESENDEISVSAKYRGLRSVVYCNGEIEPLTEEDKKIIYYTGKMIGNDDIVKYYGSKMLVKEDDSEYYMFIPKGIEKDFPKEERTTIRYYVIGFNKKIYISLVSITNINK